MIANNKLTNVKFLASPNFSIRSALDDINIVVIHNISLPPKHYGGCFIENFFLNKLVTNKHSHFRKIAKLKVSAHLLIKRNGNTIQFVAFDKCAWHAGVSSYGSRDNCNDFSIGIELEGSDDIAYDYRQYKKLNTIIKQLKIYYPIRDIVGHSDIAPERKTDPGPSFNWAKLV